MKSNRLMIALITVIALSVSALQADVAKGQKLYLKKLKSKCGMNGAKMAATHTQDEWQELKENGTLGDDLIKQCPKAEKIIRTKKFEQSVIPDLYDFFYEYANDSGNVPSCG